MVIGRVDEETVVLDLNVGSEARVEDCQDFIEPQGQQLRIIWNNLCLVSSGPRILATGTRENRQGSQRARLTMLKACQFSCAKRASKKHRRDLNGAWDIWALCWWVGKS